MVFRPTDGSERFLAGKGDAEPVAEPMRVRCYAGYRGEQEPRTLETRGRELEVLEILDRWLEPGRRCFRIRTEEGVAVLAYDEARGRWWLL